MIVPTGLGLDLSTVSTGVFWMHGDRLVKPEVFKTDGWYEALQRIRAAIFDEPFGELPSWVAIEGTYLGKNPKTFEELVGLRYSVLALLRDYGIRYYVGQPAEIDARCGITPFMPRKKRKAATKLFASTLGFELPEDAADALAVAYWGYSEYKRDKMIEDPEGWSDGV